MVVVVSGRPVAERPIDSVVEVSMEEYLLGTVEQGLVV
jgi:hypothetical protein